MSEVSKSEIVDKYFGSDDEAFYMYMTDCFHAQELFDTGSVTLKLSDSDGIKDVVLRLTFEYT